MGRSLLIVMAYLVVVESELTSYHLPGQACPTNEKLVIDVARFGPKSVRRVAAAVP